MIIKDIYWERVNLHIILSDCLKNVPYLVNDFKKIKLSYKENEIILNIMNVENGKCLDSGIWQIIVDDENIELSSTLIKKLNDYSRNFKYRNGVYACVINVEADKNKKMLIDIDYFIKNRKYKKYLRVIEGKNIFDKGIILMKILVIFFMDVLYKLLRLFSSKKRVLFLSETDDCLKENMQEVKKCIEKKYKKNVEIKVLTFNKYNSANYMNYINEIFSVAICKYIFIDNYVSMLNILPISNNQRVIQLWHAGVGFKAVGYARFGCSGGPHPVCSSHRKYSNVIVDDENLIDIYSEVFGVNKNKILPLGLPRLSSYFKKNVIEQNTKEIYKRNKILKNKKVILYSPTYRGDGQEDAYFPYECLELNEIFDFCKKNNFIFIIKMHPFVKERIDIPLEYCNVIYDYSDCNINDLIYISDIMITDYSSCAYEFSYFDRPLIFYRFDKYLYEYQRPLHTLDVFTKKQYEVDSFEDLILTLDKLKDIRIEDRFKCIKYREKGNCEKIIDAVMGDI